MFNTLRFITSVTDLKSFRNESKSCYETRVASELSNSTRLSLYQSVHAQVREVIYLQSRLISYDVAVEWLLSTFLILEIGIRIPMETVNICSFLRRIKTCLAGPRVA